MKMPEALKPISGGFRDDFRSRARRIEQIIREDVQIEESPPHEFCSHAPETPISLSFSSLSPRGYPASAASQSLREREVWCRK